MARFPGARPVLAAGLAGIPSHRLAKLQESLSLPPTLPSAYVTIRSLLMRTELTELLTPGPLREAVHVLDAASILVAFTPALPDDPVAVTGLPELCGYMHNQLLPDTDVMSMAHSLEVRVPFLDHPLVEFATCLPRSLRANGGFPKQLLLKALADRLPAEARQTKRGFAFPLGTWLHGPLRSRVEHILRNGARLFRAEVAARLQGRVAAGRTHWSRLWALVILVLWLQSVGDKNLE